MGLHAGTKFTLCIDSKGPAVKYKLVLPAYLIDINNGELV